jgi:hypothetical protein
MEVKPLVLPGAHAHSGRLLARDCEMRDPDQFDQLGPAGTPPTLVLCMHLSLGVVVWYSRDQAPHLAISTRSW